MTDFMKSRGMEEDMAENRHLLRLGVDGRLLAIWSYASRNVSERYKNYFFHSYLGVFS